jgi:predicted nucleotidyltransferase
VRNLDGAPQSLIRSIRESVSPFVPSETHRGQQTIDLAAGKADNTAGQCDQEILSVLDVESLKPAIIQLCQRVRVRRLDVFGSALTGSFRPDSDVDVLVEFEPDAGDLFSRYFDLKEGLERLLSRPVDVVVEKAMKNPYFKASIEHTRKNVYAA